MKSSEPLDIVYVSHYFPPEVNAPAVRVSELARLWQSAGHRVTVITGFPNHPTGIIPAQYRGAAFREEVVDGVRVLRTWVYAAANQGFLRRISNYLSFMLSAITLGGPRLRRADVVIGTSPQLFVAVAAWFLAVWKRARFVFEVRDVWPEEIRTVGALENRFVLRMLEGLEMFLYRRADKIVAVAQGTVDILVSRGVPREKLVMIPNGVDAASWPCQSRDDARARIGVNGAFVASYIGTHGMAHRLDTVLDAAAQLSDLPNLTILMVGDGAEKKRLQLRAREAGLTNVRFMDEVPRNRVADFYAASDVCLVPLRRAALFRKNVPSKIYEIMASSRPIVIGTEGESRALVEKAECGVAVEPENATALAAAIRRLYHSPDQASELGRRGREFVLAHNDRAVLAQGYLECLRVLCVKRDSEGD
jgi:glycosyltransferase involved in cell wall biosynthesis